MDTEEKLKALEREARRDRNVIRWLCALLILSATMWLATSVFFSRDTVTAWNLADETRTRKLVIIDELGRERIKIGEIEDSNFAIGVYDKEGNLCTFVGVYDEQGVPLLVMRDKNGRVRIGMGVTSDGTPIFQILDNNENPRIEMKVTENKPVLAMYDDKKKTRIYMSVEDENGPRLTMYDGDSKPRVDMKVTSKQGPKVTMYDDKGNVIWFAPR